MEKMLKTDFEVNYSTENEEWFVVKVCDELTKNHRDLKNLVTGIMPENKTDPLCPVASFRKYISHLHPDNKYMWQYPLDKLDPQKPNIWFSRKNIGKNPLAAFMSDVSKQCELSKIYTNHSIRVTGCTVLTHCNFSSSEIMSVSGHKSVQSLAIYQKTKDREKIQMGKALFQAMTRNEEDIDVNKKPKKIEGPREKPAIMPPQPFTSNTMATQAENAVTAYTPQQNKENVSAQIVPFEPNFDQDDLSDTDILNAICGVTENVTTTLSNTSNTSNVLNSIPKTMFANCQIGSININFGKK